jgi:hypothetical protein
MLISKKETNQEIIQSIRGTSQEKPPRVDDRGAKVRGRQGTSIVKNRDNSHGTGESLCVGPFRWAVVTEPRDGISTSGAQFSAKRNRVWDCPGAQTFGKIQKYSPLQGML